MAEIIIYGADWCGDCVRSKYFLTSRGISFQYIDIEGDPVLSEKVVNYNIEAGFGPKCRIPIILVDGSILSEPSNEELAAALGIAV